MVEEVFSDSRLLGIILRHDRSPGPGISFFTPPQFSQQLAYMNHPKGYQIGAHTHREIERQVFYTQEVLFIRKGRVRVDFYDGEIKVVSHQIEAGDVVMLVSGGHGFEMLEEAEIIEVKQGPYLGEQDKIRYEPGDH
jgi:mannose-6-phosphate isomerase-like protein (cupin superfamily)